MDPRPAIGHHRGAARCGRRAEPERQGEGMRSSFREDETDPGSSSSSGRTKAFGVLTSNPLTPSLSPSNAASTRFDRNSRGPLVPAGGLRRFWSRQIKSSMRLQSGAERSREHAVRQRGGWGESARFQTAPPVAKQGKSGVSNRVLGLANREESAGPRTNQLTRSAVGAPRAHASLRRSFVSRREHDQGRRGRPPPAHKPWTAAGRGLAGRSPPVRRRG